MIRFVPLLVVALSAGVLTLGGIAAPRASSSAPGITNVAAFLEQCPANDPVYLQIRNDFEIRREGTVVGDIPCSEPISAMQIAQYTDELIAVQTLRAIYYMEGGRQTPYPWTSSSLYDWMKSQIGGVDLRANGSYCCSQYNGKWYVVIATQPAWDRDSDREWPGISNQITLLSHETRHVDGFPHVGYCPLFPDQPYGCDPEYDEQNLSPYALEWWLNAKWLSGEIYVGFSCASPQTVGMIADFHQSVTNGNYAMRFVNNAPPTLSMPSQPGGACTSGGPTPTSTTSPTPTAGSTTTPSPSPIPTPSPTASPTSAPTPTPTPVPTQTAPPPPTATPSSPTPSPSPSTTPTASSSATPPRTPSPTPTTEVSPPPAPTNTPASTPTVSVSPAPTSPSPTPVALAQANVNCDGSTDAGDLVILLRAIGGLDFHQPAGCAAPGHYAGGVTMGDADCSGTFDPSDVLALLRYLSGLPRASDCPA